MDQLVEYAGRAANAFSGGETNRNRQVAAVVAQLQNMATNYRPPKQSVKKLVPQIEKYLRSTNVPKSVNSRLGRASNAPRNFAVSRAPAAIGTSQSNKLPKFNGITNGMRIQHTEYIGPFKSNGTGLFDVSTIFAIQPGLLSSFPWFSSLGYNFEQYKIHRLRVIIRSILPTNTSGAMYAAFDYDAADSTPVTKSQFMNNGTASSSSIWQNLVIDYSPPSTSFVNNRYIRTSNLQPNLDIKTYDSANLYLAVDGYASGNTVADVFFDYDISLMTPILNPDVAPGYSQLMTFGLSPIAEFFNIPLTNVGTPLAIAVSNNSNNEFLDFIQQGRFLLVIEMSGTTQAAPGGATLQVLSGDGNVTLVEVSTIQASTAGFAAIIVGIVVVVDTTIAPLRVNILTTGWFNSTIQCNVRIVSYPLPAG